jgi:hypothetical protein
MARYTAPHLRVSHRIVVELRRHAPFTLVGALTGIVIATVLVNTNAPRPLSHGLFWTLHPLHVVLSALTTAAMYRLNSRNPKLWAVVLIGYGGSIGIATLSDSLIPYFGEWLLDLPNRGVHLGFIEKWWLVNPLALLGIAVAYARATTSIPHAGHVLLSTWASLFHMTMALGSDFSVMMGVLVTLFLFVAVWVPCCTSDIVFPLIFASTRSGQPPVTESGSKRLDGPLRSRTAGSAARLGGETTTTSAGNRRRRPVVRNHPGDARDE